MRNPAVLAVFSALLIGTALAGCAPIYDIEVTTYNPSKTYNGTTYFQAHVAGTYISVNMQGDVLWEDQEAGPWVGGVNMGFDPLSDGNVLIMGTDVRKIVNPSSGQVLWQDNPNAGHHCVEKLPWGDVLYLSNEPFTTSQGRIWWGDVIVIVDDSTKNILWEWRLHDYVDATLHNEYAKCGTDWSHCNTAKYYSSYYYNGSYRQAILLLSRSLDTFWMIEYPSGNILWSCGQHGQFGRIEPPAEPFLSAPHELEMIAANRFMVFDNGNYRVPPVSRAKEIVVNPVTHAMSVVWSWTDPLNTMNDLSGGDADRLPNGNTLLTHVSAGRIIEVTSAGEIVWDMAMVWPGTNQVHPIYQCERVSP
jgi:hypothetical protein